MLQTRKTRLVMRYYDIVECENVPHFLHLDNLVIHNMDGGDYVDADATIDEGFKVFAKVN